jgi:hypothetical protein
MSKTNNGGGAPGRKKSGAEYRAAHRETSASHVARKQAEGLTRRSIWIPEERTVDLQLFAIFLRHQPAGSPIPWNNLLAEEPPTQTKEQGPPVKAKDRRKHPDPRQLNLFDPPSEN